MKMEALRCCSCRAHSLWNKHSTITNMATVHWAHLFVPICICVYVYVRAHTQVDVTYVCKLYFCVCMDEFLGIFYVCARVHVAVCMQICLCASVQIDFTINPKLYSPQRNPSKVGLLTCVSAHPTNDLITTLVFCGPWQFGARESSFHVC